jgi:hypothetical protein
MKTKQILFLFSLLAFFSSCKKDLDNLAVDVTGQWEWIYSYVSLNNPNPITPKTTGIDELLVFNPNLTWYKIQNNIKVDSGTYSIGHGSYTPYAGAYSYIYDSIAYYKDGYVLKGEQDYYKISNDTLQFCGCFAGLSSKSYPTGGVSKFFIKQK